MTTTYVGPVRTQEEQAWWNRFAHELAATRFIGSDALMLERVLRHVGFYDDADNDCCDMDPASMARFVWVDWCLRPDGPALTGQEREQVLAAKAAWFPLPSRSEGVRASVLTGL